MDTEKIVGWINRKLTLDADFMEDCQSYDAMEALTWDLPPGLTVHEWVRKRVSTDAHDILKTATNLFDVHHPKWEILPRGPADKDKAEELERWLEWQLELANRHGDQEAFRVMLKHSVKYNRIAAQLDYLPYWCKPGSDEYKDALNNPFCITVHNCANVHYDMGAYELRKVAVVCNVPAANVIDQWEAYQTDEKHGKKIQSAIKQIEALLEDDDEARLMYADYTDKKTRYVACYYTSSEGCDDEFTPPEGKDLVEILSGENELPFINWVISAGTSDPLLYSLHKGGLWENQNFLDTLADSTVIRRGFFPLIKHTSVSGKAMEVDFTGNEATIELNAADGENAEIMSPPPLDPGIREMMDRNSQKAASATGLKGLQNVNLAGNVQFATVNAMIQVSKSVLDPYIRNFEKAAVEMARLAFRWVAYRGDTVTGYRTRDKNTNKNKVAGEKINVSPKDFDPKSLMIRCELMSNTPTDELQKVNMYNQMKQAGWHVPTSEFIERMNLGAPEVLDDAWMKEKIIETALQVFTQTEQAKAQLQIEQIRNQMQMEMQQQMAAMQQEQQNMMAGQVPAEQPGGAQMMPGGQGNNPANQGTPPAMSSPQETRTVTQAA